MLELTIYSVLIESVVERCKELGLVGISGWLSLAAGVVIAIIANVQLVPLDVIDNVTANQIVSGIVLSGGSSFANSVRDKLRR